jgi:glycosyltransferase involved in cell wall biosynthesis
MILGIDASNIRAGGGVTHIAELLNFAEPTKFGFEKVVLWAGSATLAHIQDRDWLVKEHDSKLDRSLPWRMLWQRFHLKKSAKLAGCDLLFVPGGVDTSGFSPIVAMSQNLLPFTQREMRRYGWNYTFFRFLILRWVQARIFRRAKGVIFLSHYARKRVLQITGELSGQISIIPHGVDSRFRMEPKEQHSISTYSLSNPYKILYVSIINVYKHQWNVVEAVSLLRQQGLSLTLDLVGPAYPSALERLKRSLVRFDPEGRWVNYQGVIPYSDLHQVYAGADLGVFASSCENMPNILLETMAAGLPIACSNHGPMPEVLGDSGVYFDPEEPKDIARALRELIGSPHLREQKANTSYRAVQHYSWERCASDTFTFLSKIASMAKGAIK